MAFIARAGGVQQPADFLGGEQLRPLLGPVQSEGLLRRPLEAWTEANRRRDQAGVERVLEDGADVLDGDGEPVRPPLLRHLVPQGGEVLRVEVGHEPRLAHVRHQLIGGRLVVRPGVRRQLAGVQQRLAWR